jgi:hypothetical protein
MKYNRRTKACILSTLHALVITDIVKEIMEFQGVCA